MCGCCHAPCSGRGLSRLLNALPAFGQFRRSFLRGLACGATTEEEALANLREATELYLESFPHALKKESAIRSFDLAHA